MLYRDGHVPPSASQHRPQHLAQVGLGQPVAGPVCNPAVLNALVSGLRGLCLFPGLPHAPVRPAVNSGMLEVIGPARGGVRRWG